MKIDVPRFTIIRKKETGGITVVTAALYPDMLSDNYEFVYEYPGGSVGTGADQFANLAHILFLAGARWARENAKKEIGED